MRKYFNALPFPPLLLIAGVLLLSLVISVQSYFATQFFNGREMKSASYAINWVVPAVNYTFWAVFSPFIYRLSQRISFDRGQLLKESVVIVAAGVALAVVHEVTTSGLFFAPRLLKNWEMAAILDIVDSEYLRYGISTRFLEFLVILTVFLAIDYYKRFVRSKYTIDSMAKDLNEARLAALKMQLQPHFLFNTLNTITSLIDEDREAAQQVTCKLSNMLRDVLDSSEERGVPLRQEIASIRNYLDIEQIRYGARLNVEILVDHQTEDMIVPSLILQPLVENSFKHGFRGKSGPCYLTIEAELANGDIVMRVLDDGMVSLFPTDRRGVGLTNVARRLSHFFGGQAQFEHGEKPGGGYQSTITIKNAHDKTSYHRRRRSGEKTHS